MKNFYKKLNQKFNPDNGVEISNFLESIVAKKLIFIQITVDDDLNFKAKSYNAFFRMVGRN